MMSVETIEEQIAELDNASFSKLRDWFIEFDQSRWDKQIEVDSNAGNWIFSLTPHLLNIKLEKQETFETQNGFQLLDML